MTEVDHCASITVQPIGVVRGGRADPIDDRWEGVEALIVIDERFPPDVVDGLSEFSHLDIVYQFHQVKNEEITVGGRHPRGNPEWPKVGIFAQRGKARPNRLGVSTCRILDVDGRRITVADLDAIDGTPILDIKPHLIEMGPRGTVREPAWATELMKHYWR